MVPVADLGGQAVEFVADDAVEGFFAQRQVGHDFHTCQQCRFEEVRQFRVERFLDFFGLVRVLDDGLVAQV